MDASSKLAVPGPRTPALSEFNRAVADWSSQFAPELQRVARIVGNRMGWDHREFTISWTSLQRHYAAAYGESISLPTLKRYARLWADQGGLKIISTYRETNGRQLKKADPGRLGRDAKRVGTRGGQRMNSDSNRFAVDFDIIVKARRIPTGKRGRPSSEYWSEPWSFGSGINLPPSCPPVAGQLPRTTFNSIPTPSLPKTEVTGDGYAGEVKVEPKVAEATSPAKPDHQNVYMYWVDGQGRNRIYDLDKYKALPARRQARSSAKRAVLTPDEAAYMWTTWPKGFPAVQLQFLRMQPAQRARIIDGSDTSDRDMAKFEKARRASFAADQERINELIRQFKASQQ